MADMLVKLYTLPELTTPLTQLRTAGIDIRRAMPTEKHTITTWVRHHFSETWAVESEVALEQRPSTCFIAVEQTRPTPQPAHSYDLQPEILVGFACYDVVSRGMFGPTGVQPDHRGRKIGAALLLATLHAMAAERYAYAIIGWVGPVDFYAKTVGATLIPDSEPGIYRGPLRGM